jgi:hypothetical protein
MWLSVDYRGTNGTYIVIGGNGYWWNSAQIDSFEAWCRSYPK